MDIDMSRAPGDDSDIGSDTPPGAESLEISPAEEVEMRRQIALELENFEQGMEG
jgi:hypothetical protein